MNAAAHDLLRSLLDLVKGNAAGWAFLSLSLITGLLKRNVDRAKLSWFASYLPLASDRYSFRILVQNQRDRPLKEKITVVVDVSRSRLRRGSIVRVVHGPVGENCSARIDLRSDQGFEVVLDSGIRALATVVIIGETEAIPEGMPLSVGIGADPPVVANVTRDGLTNLANMRAVSGWWAWLGSLFVCVPLLGFTASSALQKYAGTGSLARGGALSLILLVAVLSALYSAFAFNLCRLRDTPIVLGYSESDADPDKFVETFVTVVRKSESDGMIEGLQPG